MHSHNFDIQLAFWPKMLAKVGVNDCSNFSVDNMSLLTVSFFVDICAHSRVAFFYINSRRRGLISRTLLCIYIDILLVYSSLVWS